MQKYKINDVDFFAEANLTESARTDAEAYLIDGQPAYTTLEKDSYQEVTIKNHSCVEYQFVPIDHNIVIVNESGQTESSCDGMIYYGERRNIIFVELKDRDRHSWINEAICQLEHTIKIFSKKCPHHLFGKKRAYASNRRHMIYQTPTSHREQYDKFRNLYHYRLNICGTIDI